VASVAENYATFTYKNGQYQQLKVKKSTIHPSGVAVYIVNF